MGELLLLRRTSLLKVAGRRGAAVRGPKFWIVLQGRERVAAAALDVVAEGRWTSKGSCTKSKSSWIVLQGRERMAAAAWLTSQSEICDKNLDWTLSDDVDSSSEGGRAGSQAEEGLNTMEPRGGVHRGEKRQVQGWSSC